MELMQGVNRDFVRVSGSCNKNNPLGFVQREKKAQKPGKVQEVGTDHAGE